MFESHTAVNGSYEYVSDDIILYDYVDSDGVVSNATVLEKGIMTVSQCQYYILHYFNIGYIYSTQNLTKGSKSFIVLYN